MIDVGIVEQLKLDCNDSCTILFNVAHVETALHQDVSARSPAGTPRVTHDPVVFSALGAITNDIDGVVDGF